MEPRIWSGCDNCPRIVCAELTASSNYEANGIGDTSQCGHCLGWDADSIRAAIADAVEVVDHPGEMGPHRDDFCAACGTLASVDLIDADGWCEKCAADDCGGYTSRGDAHLMAVTAPGVR